jgi:thymidylate synthase
VKQWLNLLNEILIDGIDRESRVGKTRSIFGKQIKLALSFGFPAVTTKKLMFSSVEAELAGFLRAEQDASKLQTKIWLPNAERWHNEPHSKSKHPTDMGRVYGVQWRQWRTASGLHLDQLRQVVNRIKTDPTDRRLLVSAWRPDEFAEMCLPPCHYAFQFYVANGQLSCLFVMRSVDCFLGLPFDIASYALLTHIVAQEVGLQPGTLTAQLGDTHIYHDHFNAVKEVLTRFPRKLPTLDLDPAANIDNYTVSMAKLVGYKSYPAIKATLNV